MPGTIAQYQVVIPGQVITATLWNGMELNIINNGLVWAGIDDYSATDAEMRIMTAPFPGSVTSRPTSAQGELERLRFQHDAIIGKTYWYEAPDTTLASAATNITALQANVTALQAKFPVVTADITNSNVTTAKIADASITAAKLDSAVAGNGIAGGAGTALSVNVDSSTIEINADTLRVKDAGITAAKLFTDVPAAVGLKSIQSVTTAGVFIAVGTSTGLVNTTITSVNTAKAVAIVVSLTKVSDPQPNNFVPMPTVSLTSATNVRVTLNTMQNAVGVGITYGVSVVILEFN